MSTINSQQDYDDLLMLSSNPNGDDEDGVKIPRADKNTRIKESKRARNQDNENQKKRKQDSKKERIVSDEKGLLRRPVNMTMCDDVKLALDILAARRRERPWKVLDTALRKFLQDEKVL